MGKRRIVVVGCVAIALSNTPTSIVRSTIPSQAHGGTTQPGGGRETEAAGKPQARDVTLTGAQLRAIDHYVRAEMARERVPGLQVGIYSEGRILLARGYGLANVELGVPMKPYSMMKAGSVGKQFTSAAILMLVEQGKLRLSDSVLDHFPELPAAWRPITIANLLSHTSGIADYFQHSNYLNPGSGADALFDLNMDMSDAELVAKVAKLPIEFPVGTRYAYSNTNYLLLGILIHRLTGQSRIAFLRQHIFAPIGMATARGLSNDDIIPNRASGYQFVGGVLTNAPLVSNTFNATADGGLYLNVLDLAHWDAALSGTALLKQSTLDQMWTPFRLKDDTPNPGNYGFGWIIGSENGHRMVEHSGVVSGFSCDIRRYPDDKLTVAVMVNLDGVHASAYNIAQVVAGLARSALMPAPMNPIPDNKPEIAKLARFTLERLARNEDLSDAFAPEAHYAFDPLDARDTLSQLPRNWRTAQLKLIHRDAAHLVSDYRMGSGQDSRILSVQMAPDGKLMSILVYPDRDLH